MVIPEILLIAVVIALVFGMQRRRWNDGYTMERNPRTGPGRGEVRLSSSAERDLQTYVEGLETRIAQLEERLDFTERLLMDRPSRTALPGQDTSLPDRE